MDGAVMWLPQNSPVSITQHDPPKKQELSSARKSQGSDAGSLRDFKQRDFKLRDFKLCDFNKWERVSHRPMQILGDAEHIALR